ncbi:hypothetical protein FisN_15Hu310 [Fistulifera solaris]|uniref:Uncharacterized protein n=1 Tax=Fistulifera solaris TaxID=1519565 RepID=A0A1Z5JFP7_FISSO|nr:hypothetical protein FisN_15Hu310 [Fistulifera solaris]|eukprot:GAX12830.1 hypothetical protein FisN_15Hu310 [Fistulifera solaris]
MDLQLQKWQVDKLVDWMKDNDCSSALSLAAINEPVESTGMTPSEVLVCTVGLGRIAELCDVCLDAGVAKEVMCIDEDKDEDGGVLELADDVDAYASGLIGNDNAGQVALKFGSSNSSHSLQAEHTFQFPVRKVNDRR